MRKRTQHGLLSGRAGTTRPSGGGTCTPWQLLRLSSPAPGRPSQARPRGPAHPATGQPSALSRLSTVHLLPAPQCSLFLLWPFPLLSCYTFFFALLCSIGRQLMCNFSHDGAMLICHACAALSFASALLCPLLASWLRVSVLFLLSFTLLLFWSATHGAQNVNCLKLLPRHCRDAKVK